MRVHVLPRSQAQTSDVVTSLLSLQAKTAILLKVEPLSKAAGQPQGQQLPAASSQADVGEIVAEEEIPAELVQVGHWVLVGRLVCWALRYSWSAGCSFLQLPAGRKVERSWPRRGHPQSWCR